MKSGIYFAGAALLIGMGEQAVAQSAYAYNRPVQWHVDAGYSVTTGRTADFLNNGWTIGAGLTWRPNPGTPFALRTDLHYSNYGATRQLVEVGQAATQTLIDDGAAHVVGLDVDAVLEAPFTAGVRGYATAGIGMAYRKIELTQTVAQGGYLCDPWWGFCQLAIFPGDVVVASSNTTRFAWNGGLGLDFALGAGQSWFIEARYERMETQRPTLFIPIRVGYRF